MAGRWILSIPSGFPPPAGGFTGMTGSEFFGNYEAWFFG